MTTAIIAEYNPLHQGHMQQLQQVKQLYPDEPIIIVMSGDFVQRGEPAIIRKEIRAQAAIDHGADLVLLLPTIYAIQSAQYFAQGAVSIVAKTPATRLVYGTPHPQLQQREIDTTLLKEALARGDSYAKAIELSLGQGYLDANTRLGFCYQNAIQEQQLNIDTVAVHRGPWMTDTHYTVAQQNASHLRDSLLTGQTPQGVMHAVEQPLSFEPLKPFVYYHLQFVNANVLQYPYSEPGLVERLLSTYTQADTFDQWVDKARSKRHTKARIRRFLLHLLLGITKENRHTMFHAPVDAVRPLAWSSQGTTLLRAMKEHVTILSTQKQWAKYLHQHGGIYSIEKKAESLYSFVEEQSF